MVTSNKSNIAKKRLSFNVFDSLTKSSYKKYKPKSKDYYIRDEKLEGFWIRVYPSGRKVYGAYTRKGGIGRKIATTIGECELWGFEDAKTKAKEIIQQIRYEGINPKEKLQQEVSKDKNLFDLAEDYFNDNKNLAELTKDDYLRRMKNRMPSLIKIPVTEITTDDVMSWWRTCDGARSDGIAFGYARKLLDRAVALRYVKENPFSYAKILIGELPSIKQKATHVAKDEIFDFFKALSDSSPDHGARPSRGQITSVMRDYLLFLLLTGKRRTETLSLTWENVDFKRGLIILDKGKFGKVDVVPMTDLLYAMLDYRFRMEGKTQAQRKHPLWVFQSRVGDNHITDPDRALKKIGLKSGLKFGLSSHDVRRTFSTATRELGMLPEDLAVALNHGKANVTEGYVQANVEYKRNNLEQVSSFYNNQSGGMLNTFLVHWYQGNEEFLDPTEATKPKEMDFETSRMHLLGRYQDEFHGFGHAEWKPSKDLIKKGYTKET